MAERKGRNARYVVRYFKWLDEGKKEYVAVECFIDRLTITKGVKGQVRKVLEIHYDDLIRMFLTVERINELLKSIKEIKVSKNDNGGENK